MSTHTLTPRPALIAFYFLLLSSAVFAQAPAKAAPLTPSQALDLIDQFRADEDLSLKNVQAKYLPILHYATDSTDVEVAIESGSVATDKSDYSSVFLMGYIAGNIEWQLRNGQKENRPQEGIDFELLKYRQAQKQKIGFRLPFFEELARVKNVQD